MFLILSAVLSTMLFSVAAFLFVGKYVPLRREGMWYFLFTQVAIIAMTAAFCALSWYFWMPYPAMSSLHCVLFAGAMWALYHKHTMLERLLYTGITLFLCFAIKSIMYPICSLLTDTPMYIMLYAPSTYYMMQILSNLLFMLLLVLFYRLFPPADLWALVDDRAKCLPVVVMEWVFIAGLIVSSATYHIEVDSYILAVYHIAFGIAISVGYFMLLSSFVKEVHIDEYKVRSQYYENQLQIQLAHYNAQAEYIQRFRALKHDYTAQINGLTYLLQQGETEKAKTYLDEMHKGLTTAVGDHKMYSNNKLIDAIMRDAAVKCRDKGIRFAATLTLKGNYGMSDLELCTVFINIVNNAIEAAEQVQEDKRFIEFTTTHKNSWCLIDAQNSFSGTLKVEHGEYQTIKEDAAYHGIGLKKIKETVQRAGGMVTLTPDLQMNVFHVYLQFQQQGEQPQITEGEEKKA